MSKDKALKLALEAAYLAGFNASGEGYNGEYPFGDKMQDPAENLAWKKDRDNYIEKALAQPKQFWHHNCPDSGETATEKGKPCNWCDAVEAQPEQEPVAWMEKDVLPLTHIIKAVVRREKDETYTEPLYTIPPQRTWVGLMHQERNAIRGKYWIGMSDAVFDDIEAKLKEKNT